MHIPMILLWFILAASLFLSFLVHSINRWTQLGACCAASSAIISQLKSWSDLASLNLWTELILLEHNSLTSFLSDGQLLKQHAFVSACSSHTQPQQTHCFHRQDVSKLLTRWCESNRLEFLIPYRDLQYLAGVTSEWLSSWLSCGGNLGIFSIAASKFIK